MRAVVSTANGDFGRLAELLEPCGVGLSIDGDDGARYIYCHGSRPNGLAVEDRVEPGDLLMWSGDSGRSGAPHLHLEVRVSEVSRCPQLLLTRLLRDGRAVPPVALPSTGCTF